MMTTNTPKCRGALHVLAKDFGLDSDKVRRVPLMHSAALYRLMDHQGYKWTGRQWQRKPLPLYLQACQRG